MFYASHEALTKLPNRASVLRKIDRALATPDHHRRLRAVLFIDVDDLKTVNDTWGTRVEFGTPRAVGPTTTAIHASIGVVEVDHNEQRSADDILRDADLAMYDVKRANRGHGHKPQPRRMSIGKARR